MDIFEFYRNLLFLILSVYTLVMTASMLVQFGWIFTSPDRMAAMLRKYLAVMLLRLTFRPLMGQLLQNVALLALFIWLVWLH